MPKILKESDFDSPGEIIHESEFDDQQQPQSRSAWDYMMGRDIDGGKYDILGKAAKLGQFANKGNQELSGLSAEGLGQYGIPPILAALPGTVLGTTSEFLIPQTRVGAASLLAEPMAKAIGYGAQAISSLMPQKGPGMIASLAQGMARLRPKSTQFYLDNPDEVMNAMSLKEATENYKNSIGNLAGRTRSIAQRLNKTVLSEGDYTEAINRSARILNGSELDAAGNPISLTPQDALEGVQTINRFLKNNEFTRKMDAQQIAEIANLKDELLDFMQKNGNPNIRSAAYELFKAHVKDDFSKLTPQNKYGSTDALRTWLSVGTLGSAAGTALATGHPLAAIPAAAGVAATSPKMWSIGINNISALSKPQTIGNIGAIGKGISNYMTSPEGINRQIQKYSNPFLPDYK